MASNCTPEKTKKCKDRGKICNPNTGRCIKVGGRLYKTIFQGGTKESNSITKDSMSKCTPAKTKKCKDRGKICNPITGRCINIGGTQDNSTKGSTKSSSNTSTPNVLPPWVVPTNIEDTLRMELTYRYPVVSRYYDIDFAVVPMYDSDKNIGVVLQSFMNQLKRHNNDICRIFSDVSENRTNRVYRDASVFFSGRTRLESELAIGVTKPSYSSKTVNESSKTNIDVLKVQFEETNENVILFTVAKDTTSFWWFPLFVRRTPDVSTTGPMLRRYAFVIIPSPQVRVDDRYDTIVNKPTSKLDGCDWTFVFGKWSPSRFGVKTRILYDVLDKYAIAGVQIWYPGSNDVVGKWCVQWSSRWRSDAVRLQKIKGDNNTSWYDFQAPIKPEWVHWRQ